MKKIIFSIFLMLYVVSNIGATVQLHMCCGDIVNWTLKEINGNDNRHGSCCAEEIPEDIEGCCEDQSIDIKISDPQIVQNIDYLFNASLAIAHKQFVDYSDLLVVDRVDGDITLFPIPPPTEAERIGLFILYKQMKLAC